MGFQGYMHKARFARSVGHDPSRPNALNQHIEQEIRAVNELQKRSYQLSLELLMILADDCNVSVACVVPRTQCHAPRSHAHIVSRGSNAARLPPRIGFSTICAAKQVCATFGASE